MADTNVLGIVLAGGEGKRLSPLTLDRAKPAVPFGGLYRLIDFALSNLVNAGVLRIAVLTQYKSHSLDRHITTTWRMSSLLANYVTPVPAQQRLGPQWYTGSADAIYQSLNLIHDEKPDLVIVFGADHVYRMDPRQMIAQHIDSGAGATVAGIPVPRKEASAFGVIKTASDGQQVEAFLEKPSDPPGLPGRPDETFVSMGNYLFSADVLVEALRKDAADESSKHDMGGNIMPMMVDRGMAQVYDFQRNEVPGADPADAGYWRDVGTLDSYYDAHMDLCAVVPVFNLYNSQWPILTHIPPHPPAKFVHEDGERVGHAVNSVVSNGVIVSGALVRESVLSPGARIEDYAIVERSVIMDNTVVAANAVVQNAIIDKDVVVPEGAQVGVDKDHDRARGFVVSDGGVPQSSGQAQRGDQSQDVAPLFEQILLNRFTHPRMTVEGELLTLFVRDHGFAHNFLAECELAGFRDFDLLLNRSHETLVRRASFVGDRIGHFAMIERCFDFIEIFIEQLLRFVFERGEQRTMHVFLHPAVVEILAGGDQIVDPRLLGLAVHAGVVFDRVLERQ